MVTETALYMIPVAISEGDPKDFFPDRNALIVGEIKHFIVENVRTARRFLKKLSPETDINSLTFYELNGHTPENEISGYLNPLREGRPIGMMSEAGCPGVADPGAAVVAIAQSEGMKVVPLIGPSSILLSLMASGLNGQRFAFNGYLPVGDTERAKALHEYESQSRRNDITQIFIETPYRNMKLMESLVKTLQGDTLLCVARDVTGITRERITTKTVKQWKKEMPQLEKVPTIFLFYSGRRMK